MSILLTKALSYETIKLGKTIESFSLEYLVEERGVTAMELFVAEAPSQSASCRVDLIEVTSTSLENKRRKISSLQDEFHTSEAIQLDEIQQPIRTRQVKPCLVKNDFKAAKVM